MLLFKKKNRDSIGQIRRKQYKGTDLLHLFQTNQKNEKFEQGILNFEPSICLVVG
jgi:hypothetical protein